MSPFMPPDAFRGVPEDGESPGRTAPSITDLQIRAVFDAMSEGLVILGPTGEILEANRSAERVLGLTRDQIVGRTPLDPIWRAVREDGSPFDGPDHPAAVTLRTGEALRDQLMGVRIEGQPERWISINTQPIHAPWGSGPSGVVATFVDVTAQRSVLAELRQSRSDLAAILEHVPARVTAWNLDYTNRFANRHAEQAWNLPPGGAQGRTAAEILGPERYARARPSIERALAGLQQTHDQVDPQADGSRRYSLVTYVPKFRDGQVVGLYVLGFDVTPLRAVQDELQAALQELRVTTAAIEESEHRLRTVANGVPMSIALFDAEERILFANDEFRRLENVAHAIEGVTAKDYFRPELYERGRPARARALAGERIRFEVMATIGVEQRTREVTYSPFRDAEGRIQGVYALAYDVTELQRSRERIRELAQRLASVREEEKVTISTTLHEGIAQQLFAARLALEQLGKGRDGDGRWQALVGEVAAAIESTVAELRRLTNDLVPISLANLPLATTLRIHAEDCAARHGFRLAFEIVGDIPQASIDVRLLLFRALQQVLANAQEHGHASSVAVALSADSDALTLSVIDNGTGIEGTATEKPGSHGVLYFSERFQALGGTFTAQPAPAGGTVVLARLPLGVARTPQTEAVRGFT